MTPHTGRPHVSKFHERQGEEVRARIRNLLRMGGIAPGKVLPRHTWLAGKIGVSQSQATRHLHRVLSEDGILVERGGRRLRVVAVHHG